MAVEFTDFNGAEQHFDGDGRDRWLELESVFSRLPIFLQPSDEKGKKGKPIFDPKATNAWLTNEAAKLAWQKVPVPTSLTAFGLDWDGGKEGVLAEWQFSNYPFLWNNVIRSEALFRGKVAIEPVGEVKALVVVTKSGCFPASNSTLYYEQAKAQLNAVTAFGAFTVPIRLVCLSLPSGAATLEVTWTEYPGRYARQKANTTVCTATLNWRKKRKFEYDYAEFDLER